MQQTKAWYHTVSGLFHAEKPSKSHTSAQGFSPHRSFCYCAPKKCKDSVFEAQILLQNQANPQILLPF